MQAHHRHFHRHPLNRSKTICSISQFNITTPPEAFKIKRKFHPLTAGTHHGTPLPFFQFLPLFRFHFIHLQRHLTLPSTLFSKLPRCEIGESICRFGEVVGEDDCGLQQNSLVFVHSCGHLWSFGVMMAMELGLRLKSSAAPVTAVAAPREKSVGSTSVHFWSRISSPKVDLRSGNFFGRVLGFVGVDGAPSTSTSSAFAVRASSSTAEKGDKKARFPGEKKGFVEEMRFVAMKLHTKDQSKEGEKEADVQPVGQWKPSIVGYLKFLVDSKLVYDTMEAIVEKSAHPSYELFRNTGLERADKLAKDFEWFASQGYEIPEAGLEGTTYAKYLTELSETDPPAFICHFYNVYFAHSAGGKFIGKKVAEILLDGRELEFYKWDGELPQLLGAVKSSLNKVAEDWTREQKNHCLKETENSFKYSGKILRLIISSE